MNEEALSTLTDGLATGAVPSRDVEFATSLVAQAQQARGLSAKQWYWVAKLAGRLTATKEAVVVADMSRVYSLFAKAKEHLRFPKVHLHAGGRVLKLYVSTARSRVPNVVNVVEEATYTWYGRIDQNGEWTPGNATPEQVNSVANSFREFAADPEGIAAKSGHLSGNCCFCNRGLTDDRSTDVGYGPTCAQKWGLSWGKKSK